MRNLLFASIALAFTALQGVAQSADNAVYFVAQIQITDPDGFFNSYGAKVGPNLLEAGAEVLAATPERTQLEGDWPGDWTVILKFPSQEKALEWYQSDAYQTIRPLRLESTSLNNLLFVPGFVPPQ